MASVSEVTTGKGDPVGVDVTLKEVKKSSFCSCEYLRSPMSEVLSMLMVIRAQGSVGGVK